ncbi:hypothetical protein HIM_10976 [Hirsutella minnesotensis 3608]|uniref:Uncharacterized protein n=1 Tax=Hirsutella minnesotensis 3608 TaxID=1043627 RepID=A0A0F7ZWV6_9HYPO|nr:hypothetical protein HIM_10976 [Hirsutella minnesotensis 3608]
MFHRFRRLSTRAFIRFYCPDFAKIAIQPRFASSKLYQHFRFLSFQLVVQLAGVLARQSLIDALRVVSNSFWNLTDSSVSVEQQTHPPKSDSTASSRQELNRSRQELNRSRQELNRSRQELNRSRQELNRSRQELNRSRQELNRSRQELNRSRQELNRSRQELNRSRQELNRSRQELNRSRQELNRSRQELPPKSDSTASSRQELNRSRQELNRSRQELNRSVYRPYRALARLLPWPPQHPLVLSPEEFVDLCNESYPDIRKPQNDESFVIDMVDGIDDEPMVIDLTEDSWSKISANDGAQGGDLFQGISNYVVVGGSRCPVYNYHGVDFIDLTSL